MTKAELLAALKDVPDDARIFVTDDLGRVDLKDVQIVPDEVWLLLPNGATLAPDLGKDRTLEWNLWRARQGMDPIL